MSNRTSHRSKRGYFYHRSPVSTYAVMDPSVKKGYVVLQKTYTDRDTGAIHMLHPTKGWRRMAKQRTDNTYLSGYAAMSTLLSRVLGKDFFVTP